MNTPENTTAPITVHVIYGQVIPPRWLLIADAVLLGQVPVIAATGHGGAAFIAAGMWTGVNALMVIGSVRTALCNRRTRALHDDVLAAFPAATPSAQA